MAYVDPQGLLTNLTAPAAPAAPQASFGELTGGGLQGLLTEFRRSPFGEYMRDTLNDPVSMQFLSNAFGAGADGKTPFSGIPQAIALKQDMVIQKQQAERQAKADQRQEDQYNQTVSWLTNNHPDLAEMVKGGLSVTDAYSEAMRRSKPQQADPFTLGAGQTRYDGGGNIIAQGAPDIKEEFGYEKDLAAQYGGQDSLKTYHGVRNGYERVRASAQANSGPGDVSMIFAYMKMLDPASVVREGEFATAENSGGVGQQITNIYNRLLTGERLTPELRRQFLAAADQLYAETASNLSDLNSQYETRAGAWGVDPTRFIVNPEQYDTAPGGTDPMGLR